MEHALQCPMHEDNNLIHECEGTGLGITIEWNNFWNLSVNPSMRNLHINFCPFCGDELDIVTCKCAEIRQGLRERELDLKYEGAI